MTGSKTRGKVLLLAVLMGSCGPTRGKTDVQSIEKADAFLHKKSNLKVCFVVGEKKLPFSKWFIEKGFPRYDFALLEFTTQVREAIKDVVTKEFTKNLTGLTFSGFEDCDGERPATDQADVYIFRSVPLLAEGEFLKTIDEKYKAMWGMNAESSAPTQYDMPTRLQFDFERYCVRSSVKIPYFDCVKLDALHEFGHVAGLGHAHEHPDAKDDPACRLADGSLIGGTGVVSKSRKIAGAYQPGSIMNYCGEEAYVRGDPNAALKSIEFLGVEREIIKKRTPK